MCGGVGIHKDSFPLLLRTEYFIRATHVTISRYCSGFTRHGETIFSKNQNQSYLSVVLDGDPFSILVVDFLLLRGHKMHSPSPKTSQWEAQTCASASSVPAQARSPEEMQSV